MQTKSKPKDKKHKIIIYGEKWCPFCKNAKTLAKKITKDFKFVAGKSGIEIKKLIKTKTVPKTIPQIVVNGKHIGGFSNLQSLFMKIGK